MTSTQREVRAVVVEIGILPTGGVMTGVTFHAKLAIMLIVLLVTGVTFAGCAFEHIIPMTGFASHFRMLAF